MKATALWSRWQAILLPLAVTFWQTGQASLYGRVRQVKYQEVLCQWQVLGHDVVVKAVFAVVEGYQEPFTLGTSASELSGLPVVELFCARFRQEDGFRDLTGWAGSSAVPGRATPAGGRRRWCC